MIFFKIIIITTAFNVARIYRYTIRNNVIPCVVTETEFSGHKTSYIIDKRYKTKYKYSIMWWNCDIFHLKSFFFVIVILSDRVINYNNKVNKSWFPWLYQVETEFLPIYSNLKNLFLKKGIIQHFFKHSIEFESKQLLYFIIGYLLKIWFVTNLYFIFVITIVTT